MNYRWPGWVYKMSNEWSQDKNVVINTSAHKTKQTTNKRQPRQSKTILTNTTNLKLGDTIQSHTKSVGPQAKTNHLDSKRWDERPHNNCEINWKQTHWLKLSKLNYSFNYRTECTKGDQAKFTHRTDSLSNLYWICYLRCQEAFTYNTIKQLKNEAVQSKDV